LHVACQARLRKRLHNSGKSFPVWPTSAVRSHAIDAANKALSVESAFGTPFARIAAFESLSANRQHDAEAHGSTGRTSMFDMATIGRVVSLGANVQAVRDGDSVFIRIDLTQDLGPSKSGKTNMIASTQGNRNVPGTDVKIGVNCYR
jgi:hypothetical protein